MERNRSASSADMIRTIFLEREALKRLVARAERGEVAWEAKTQAEEASYVQVTGRWAGL